MGIYLDSEGLKVVVERLKTYINEKIEEAIGVHHSLKRIDVMATMEGSNSGEFYAFNFSITTNVETSGNITTFYSLRNLLLDISKEIEPNNTTIEVYIPASGRYRPGTLTEFSIVAISITNNSTSNTINFYINQNGVLVKKTTSSGEFQYTLLSCNVVDLS